jgi:DNA-binding CsgD family transcriptional regulator
VERLTRRDLRHLLEFVRDLYASHDLDGLSTYALRRLPALVASEITVYNELDPRRHRALWREEPSVAAIFPDGRQVFEQHMGEHPLIAHTQRAPGGRAAKISDFLTQRQFRRLGLYQEFFRRVGAEYQMAIGLPAALPLVVGITLNRGTRDFTERDRLVLDLLRPHLAQAYRNAGLLTEFREAVALAGRGLDHLARGLIVTTPDARVRFATERARRWVREYLGPDGRAWPGRHLPEALAGWVRCRTAALASADALPEVPGSLVLERPQGRLEVRLVLESSQCLLLLDESPAAWRPGPLEAHGLTTREAEVLRWVARGKTNADIAAILGARPRTVAKHLERVFRKLGVETRTAAAVQARGLLLDGDDGRRAPGPPGAVPAVEEGS